MSAHVGPVGLPIDGRERATREGWTVPVRSPATGEPLWELPDAGLEDAQDAVEAAWRAVHATGWSTDSPMRLKALLGLIKPDNGRISVLDLDVAAAPLEIRARVGYMPESDAQIPGLSAIACTRSSTTSASVKRAIATSTPTRRA